MKNLQFPFTLLLCAALMVSASTRVFGQGDQPSREELANNPILFLKLTRKTLKWDEPAEPAKLVGPIYSVGTKGLSVFLIKTTEGLIMINTAMQIGRAHV